MNAVVLATLLIAGPVEVARVDPAPLVLSNTTVAYHDPKTNDNGEIDIDELARQASISTRQTKPTQKSQMQEMPEPRPTIIGSGFQSPWMHREMPKQLPPSLVAMVAMVTVYGMFLVIIIYFVIRESFGKTKKTRKETDDEPDPPSKRFDFDRIIQKSDKERN